MSARQLQSLLLFLALQCLAPAWASPLKSITDIYVFGDSLSDQGNVYAITGHLVPPPEYSDGANVGRFTNSLANSVQKVTSMPTAGATRARRPLSFIAIRALAKSNASFQKLNLTPTAASGVKRLACSVPLTVRRS